MAVRPIVQVGDPVLRRRAREVDLAELPALAPLIDDMRDTMRAAPGVGLAAPQIGESLRLAVIEDPHPRSDVAFHVLVNPVLTIRSEDIVEAFEGCLSFSGFSMIVPRARKVRVEAFDERGERFVKVATGWYARILQHECDHLDGIVCCDRMHARTLTTTANAQKYWAERTVDEVHAAVALAPPDDDRR